MNKSIEFGTLWHKPKHLNSCALKRVECNEFGGIHTKPVEYPVTIVGEPAKEPGDKTTVWYPAMDTAGEHIWITERGLAAIEYVRVPHSRKERYIPEVPDSDEPVIEDISILPSFEPIRKFYRILAGIDNTTKVALAVVFSILVASFISGWMMAGSVVH